MTNYAAFAAVLVLAGCVSAPPSGPSILVLPGTGKSFDHFRSDDHECQQYAAQSVGGKTPKQAVTESGMTSAIVGAAIGTAAGAAIGGSEGARVGAGVGLAGGALAGTGAARRSSLTLQQRYDFGDQQCMYAKGHKIPMSRAQAARERAARVTPHYDAATTPPPPPPPGYKVN